MARVTPLTYQGPDTVYKPPLADSNALVQNVLPNNYDVNAYHDLDYLKDLLDNLIARSLQIYTQCENALQNFALTIDQTNTDLLAAQAAVYPGTTIPNTITFQQYKYNLVNNNTNASQYIITAYENAVSGSSGTNSLDISKISLMINSEAKRIKEFINGHVGDLSDSSEHRTIELFQDWAENAAHIIERFWEAFQGKVTSGLPGSELGQLTPEKANQLQALFQIKLNVANKSVSDLFGQLSKNWDQTSSVFYGKTLGPGLKFQLGVRKQLNTLTDTSMMPTIANEISNTFSNLNDGYAIALQDQHKRNMFFIDLTAKIVLMISQRDTYRNYMQQLSAIGKTLPVKFTSSSTVDEHPDVLNASHPLDIVDATKNPNTNFRHDHDELTGITDDYAHPQYLLRSGGANSTITGDVFVASGVKIDGVDLSLHEHSGVDGSPKIHSSNIILDTNLDSTSFTPSNLKLVSKATTVVPPGLTKISARISFDVNETGVVSYEIEFTKLPN